MSVRQILFIATAVEVLNVLVVKHLKGLNHPMNDLGGDVNIESDCEGDIPVPRDDLLNTNGETGEEVRAVLITGSFSAYVDFTIPSPSRKK